MGRKLSGWVLALAATSLAAAPAWGAEQQQAAKQQAKVPAIHLNSGPWLKHLNLDREQLERIRKAVAKALTAPIDEEIQCGKVYMDCTVRAAREWISGGVKHRQIVIVIHKGPQSGGPTGSKAFAMNVVRQVGGQWPEIRI